MEDIRPKKAERKTSIGLKKIKQYVTPVFWISICIVGLVVLLGSVFSTEFQYTTEKIRNFISNYLGWYYLLLVAGIVFFCLIVIISPVSQIRLGDPDSKPEYSTPSWIAMLFSAGMGIGLVFGARQSPYPTMQYPLRRVRLAINRRLRMLLNFPFSIGASMRGRFTPLSHWRWPTLNSGKKKDP